MLGLVSPSYLLALFGDRKHLGKHAHCSQTPWTLALRGLGCALLDRHAHHDAGYAHGVGKTSLPPPGELDDVPEAQGIRSGGSTRDRLGPAPTKMWS
jgi:hypothetical protein